MQTSLLLSSSTTTRSIVCTSQRANGVSRRPVICKAESSSESTPSTSTSTSSPKYPEWLPEAAVPVLQFLESDDFSLESSPFYADKIKPYAENEWVQKSVGWKTIPELINARAAMIGFVAAAGAEILGAGPVLKQVAGAPQPVILVIALLTAATIIPIKKGTEGEYLASLRDSYSLPDGVFTETNEKVHGRLAMIGITVLIALELLAGRAIL